MYRESGGASGASAWNAAQLAPMEAMLTSRRMAARFMAIDLLLHLLQRLYRSGLRAADERPGPVRGPDGESAAARDSGARAGARFSPQRACRRFPCAARGPFPAFVRVADRTALRSNVVAGPWRWLRPARLALAQRAIALPRRKLALLIPRRRRPFPYRQSLQFLLRCFRRAKHGAARVRVGLARWPRGRSCPNGCFLPL